MYRILLIISLVFSCNIYAQDAYVDYVVGEGDQISIKVYRSDDLSTDARVSSNGEITFPLIGQIKVANRTTTQVSKIIRDALTSKKLLVSPQVNVTVTDYQSKTYAVFGHVTTPGKYPIKRPLKLTDAIAIAGGYTLTASDIVTIISEVEGKTVNKNYDVKRLLSDVSGKSNPRIQPGDIVQVPKHAVFYIHGQVNNPGEYKLEPNMRISQALAIGGGVTLRGTTRSMKVERADDKGEVSKINAKTSMLIQPNDVIYVNESLF